MEKIGIIFKKILNTERILESPSLFWVQIGCNASETVWKLWTIWTLTWKCYENFVYCMDAVLLCGSRGKIYQLTLNLEIPRIQVPSVSLNSSIKAHQISKIIMH